VDDVFAANVWSAVKLGPDNVPAAEGENKEYAKEEEEDPPEEEWIESSSDEDKRNDIVNNNPEFDLSQDLSIQKLRQDKAKIMKDLDEKGDPYQQVLV
jgi:hypothetical protein